VGTTPGNSANCWHMEGRWNEDPARNGTSLKDWRLCRADREKRRELLEASLCLSASEVAAERRLLNIGNGACAYWVYYASCAAAESCEKMPHAFSEIEKRRAIATQSRGYCEAWQIRDAVPLNHGADW